MKKFIHICPDEKFINSAIDLFQDVDKDNHDFFIYSNEKKLKYVEENHVSISTFNSANLFKYIFYNRRKFKDKTVIFHSAQRLAKIISCILPKNTKIVWIGFGYDYYCYSYKQKNFNVISYVLNKFFLNRVDFFSPVLDIEYKIVKNYFPKFKAKLLIWNYDLISKFIVDKENLLINGNNILIGNSATESNNHKEIFHYFEKENIQISNSRKIIVPLSYGNLDYKRKIINDLKKVKLPIYTLTEFLPIDTYYQKISSCSHVIMNHDRQQAYGNIAIALFMGCKVFLKENNPLYFYLLNKGFILYKIEDIITEINLNLDEKDHSGNKNKIIELFSREEFISKTKKFISEIK